MAIIGAEREIVLIESSYVVFGCWGCIERPQCRAKCRVFVKRQSFSGSVITEIFQGK